jgi:prepilin-type N-terminal cleavage/methylation domain-containing protein
MIMSQPRNRGFTLIEIAIVLVIIGLLLGGVLKGQELINNARVKSFANDFRNVPVYIYAYQDRFRAIPGDDPLANTHVNGTVATTPAATLNNGQINGAWNSTTNTDESCLFWQHIRLANLAPGNTTVSCNVAGGAGYYPANAAGGIVGIQQGGAAFTFITLPTTMSGTYIICSSHISGQFVLSLDTLMDDGNPATGAMRAIDESALGAATAATSAQVSANLGGLYTVCLGV